MSEEKIANLLGLAKRASGLITGNDACMQAIRSGAGKALLAIVATDTGDNAMKKYHDKCKSFGVPLLKMFDKERLGRAVGKEHGAIVVITDKGFANRILQLSDELDGSEAD
ncbi:ribosomal L7Ae/L30e/S12e/Gadd45 family protein [Tumebacillus sp. ITR2]|uniref:Ribosomal L7Ae/L30e/S12e/Gadd45 family protein n=1 Tax=Tumebacillus amylolyticus TaxID=2801339 RepID=A0ABS1JFF2_9BACL|nr:ribosomal L7Ae/L30e/S12e/Gadd45 family protein [Tumebacillus amylolyticus]MBL0388955.1 ribosomal L7Ae/L30e/S12e/Gadd45 family protein [Tumebacillus amylolyticus]